VGLKIESAEADRLARELAERTWESGEQAVVRALRRALVEEMRERIERDVKRERIRFDTGDPRVTEAIREIQERVAKLPVIDDRPADELLGYDETGLPH
jgi:antitoxin VapB